MSTAVAHALAAAPPLVPLAWNFVVPAFLGFLVGSTYVLAFGLAAALVVWIGSSVLFALWLVTGLYPFNRLALIGFAVGGALVLRAAWELAARAARRIVGRVRLADLAEGDRRWAGDEAVALGRLGRMGARVAPAYVDRRVRGTIVRCTAGSGGRTVILFTRRPGGGPVSIARLEWAGGTRSVDLDRIAVRAVGADAARAACEVPLAECFVLLDRAEASATGAARLICTVTSDGALELAGCEAMAAAEWTAVWLAGAGVDLAADPVSPLEQELTEAAWGWDRLLLGRRSADDVRFVAHRPYVSFEAARGGARSIEPTRHPPDRRVPARLGLGVLMRDLTRVGRGAAMAAPAGELQSPREAVLQLACVCRDGLAPMHAWSAVALRAVRWIEAVVGDRARRDELLVRIQAPEARALQAIGSELAELRALLIDEEPTSSGSWSDVASRLEREPGGVERRAALERLLARHRHRGPGERTLAGVRLGDAPAVVREVLGGAGLASPGSPLQPLPNRPDASLLARLDPFEWWMSAVAALGAFAVRRRMAARERATRGLAALREALLSHGQGLAAREALAAPGDVFWLTLPEWRSVLEGTADPRPAVERRRVAFEADAARPARAVIVEGDGILAPFDRDLRVLQGIATSAGVARGRAIGPVDENVGWDGSRGGVLVLDDANPALVARLASVAAVVCERGGLLSHLAIVARELGVPAVMGVADAAKLLVPGTMVEVDGGRGEVRLLDVPNVVAGASAPDAASPRRGLAAPGRR